MRALGETAQQEHIGGVVLASIALACSTNLLATTAIRSAFGFRAVTAFGATPDLLGVGVADIGS